jgi:chromosomal replication initiator protein
VHESTNTQSDHAPQSGTDHAVNNAKNAFSKAPLPFSGGISDESLGSINEQSDHHRPSRFETQNLTTDDVNEYQRDGMKGRTDEPGFGDSQMRIERIAHNVSSTHGSSSLNTSSNENTANASQPSHQTVLNQIRDHLVNSQGFNKVRRYLSSTVSLRCTDDSTLEIIAADRFTLEMIERRLGDPLRIAAQFAMGTTTPNILYRVEITENQTTRKSISAGRNAQSRQSTNANQTHPLATQLPSQRAAGPRGQQRTKFPACPSLHDFLIGASNRLAFESVKQTLQSRMDTPPVFIHGSCGVGKTHLLRGATQYARTLKPGCKVRYTTGEAFTNGFVNAIRTRSVDVFQKKYRGLDLLCIDDIHLMAGKQATQHELLQIFNTLSLGGAKIIFASDAHPREIGRLDQALASRFSAGLVVEVEDPDVDLARRLVSQIASQRGVFLDAPAIQTIVERVGIGNGASVRDLEGAVIQIQAVARMMDRGNDPKTPNTTGSHSQASSSPTMMHVRKALSLRCGEENQPSTGPIALDSIITQICDEMTVSKSDLYGKGRQKKVVMARELIVHTARNLTSKSFPEIAHAIGRPNHSTVITAAKRFKDRVKESEPVAVGCPHDGIPAGELAQMMASRVHR